MRGQRKGEFLSVKVDDNLVRQEISLLQHSLIGRLSLATGDSPYTLEDLTSRLVSFVGYPRCLESGAARQRLL